MRQSPVCVMPAVEIAYILCINMCMYIHMYMKHIQDSEVAPVGGGFRVLGFGFCLGFRV